jgi:endonuclease G
MNKKIKSTFKLPFFKPSWIGIFFTGLAIGIGSQHIPQIKSYTDEIIRPIEQTEMIKNPIKVKSSPLGMPQSHFFVKRNGYSLGYDAQHRNPAWVYEDLTAANIKGSVDRDAFNFKEDTNIPEHLRALLIDYKGQGFDRGHMAPAADHRASKKEMEDTFYLTNMCPQCPELNRGYWSKLERHIRSLTKNYAHVYVITGPLYLPYTDVDGNRYVKYQVIGKNDIAVPTHFFKIISLENRNGYQETQAYILPNQPIEFTTQLDSFKATVQKVERLSGILFPFK